MMATYLILSVTLHLAEVTFLFMCVCPSVFEGGERKTDTFLSQFLPQDLHSQINRAILYQGALKPGFQENSMQSDMLRHSKFPVGVKFPQ